MLLILVGQKYSAILRGSEILSIASLIFTSRHTDNIGSEMLNTKHVFEANIYWSILIA